MFWRFGGYANLSTIDSILDKPDFPLGDLLDESDLLEELKHHNAKLVEYLREQPVLEKLLDYVVAPKLEPVTASDEDEDGDNDAKGKDSVQPFSQPRGSLQAIDGIFAEQEGEKRRNQYAYVAAEILSSDNWSIYEALMESKHLLRNFWKFLKRPAPLDPLQASYFTKVNESLFDKKTEEMLELLKTLDNAVPDMIKHVDSPMVMDLLLKIISLERTDSGQGVVEWLYTQDVMPTLLSYLGPQHSWATQTSAGDFLKAIITVSANASQNEQTCIGPNELTRQLVSKPCVEQLVRYMLGGGNPLTVGVGIIIEVIRKNNSDYDPEVGQEQSAAPPSSRDPIYLGTLLRLFADHVPDFMRLIMNAPAQKERLDSTFGDKIEPLGFDRFKTCELMAELLHCSNMGLLNEVGAEEIIMARDEERQRLRDEGRLGLAASASAPSSAEDLTMRSVARSISPDESRKLEVTNSSTDDEGFEEITHGAEGDASHESVQADEDMPMPDLPHAPANPATSSFLDKDDDFVDEPLSSPRLNVQDVEAKADDDSFEDPDLVVPPLSPTKRDKPAEASLSTAVESETDEIQAMITNAVLAGSEAPTADAEKTGHDAESGQQGSPPTSGGEQSLEVASHTTQGGPALDGLSPHPEDTPAPLFFSDSTGPPDSKPLAEEDATVADVSTSTPVDAETKQLEQSEGSIIVGHATEQQEASTLTLASDKNVAPVVGDYLKMQFVDHHVVPTILSFFFKYPWNNFLHNVVYDVVQQVFNGPMDRGYNAVLAISLFDTADITGQIIRGQLASELSQARTNTRMGYMGHLTLIAEEVVKFTDRHPPELLSSSVLDRVMAPEWCSYVDGALAETRERDNAILGGVRPEVAMSNRAGAAAGGGASGLAAAGLANIGLSSLAGSGVSHTGSSALAEAGLDGGSSAGQFAISAGTLMSGFGSSSDEEDDEEQDNEEDVNNEFRAYTDPLNASQSSSLAPPSIPPPPPPPPPLNVPPSRARLQLAARLAKHKQDKDAADAASAAAAAGDNEADTNGSTAADSGSGGDSGNGSSSLPFPKFQGLQAAPELTREQDRDMRDPFADDEEDDEDGSGSDDEGEEDDDMGGGSGWQRGGWWRGVVRRAALQTQGGGGGGGGGRSEQSGRVEKFGDGRDDDSDSDGPAADEVDEVMDDEEFGDFAMPEVDAAGRQQGGGTTDNQSGTTAAGSNSITGIDPAREKVLLKPLPLHPAANKAGGSPFGSLWPFSGPAFGSASKEKETVVPSGDGADEFTEEPLEVGAGEGVLSEDGRKIDRAVEAKRRTSIEDPDDDSDVEVGEEIMVGRGGL